MLANLALMLLCRMTHFSIQVFGKVELSHNCKRIIIIIIIWLNSLHHNLRLTAPCEVSLSYIM